MTNSVTQANLDELRNLAQALASTMGVLGVGFDASSSTDVNLSTETFNIPAHGFSNGDVVTYYQNTNTALGGLTDGAKFYIKNITANSFQLATFASGPSGATVNISSLGTGNQFFVKADASVVSSVSSAASIDLLYRRIQDARRLAYSDIDSNASTIFTTLLNALQPVSAAYNNYIAGRGTLSALTTALSTLSSTGNKAGIGQFQGLLDTFNRSWDIQDRVFFEYSKTGEADLNTQLGQLGDALDSLSRVIQVVNKIDLAISVNPRNSSGTSLVNADSTLESTFYSDGADDLFIGGTSVSVENSTAINTTSNTITSANNGFANGDRVIVNSSATAPGGLTSGNTYYIVGVSGNSFQLSSTSGGAGIDFSSAGTGTLTLTKQINAMKYIYQAMGELTQLQGTFASGTSVRTAINTVLSSLNSYGVDSSWGSAVDPDQTGAAAAWATGTHPFKSLWESDTFRRQVNDLQTNLSSQNDVQKENLRKAMFIYQEFVKSAGTVMDRVYDAIKGIASRIGR